MPRRVGNGVTVQLAARIPQAIYRAMKLATIEEDTTVQDWVREALAAYLTKVTGAAVTDADEKAPGRAPVTLPRPAKALA